MKFIHKDKSSWRVHELICLDLQLCSRRDIDHHTAANYHPLHFCTDVICQGFLCANAPAMLRPSAWSQWHPLFLGRAGQLRRREAGRGIRGHEWCAWGRHWEGWNCSLAASNLAVCISCCRELFGVSVQLVDVQEIVDAGDDVWGQTF